MHDQTPFILYTQLKPEATTDSGLTLIHISNTNAVMKHFVVYSFLMSLFFMGIVQPRDFIYLPEDHRVKLLENPPGGVSVVRIDRDPIFKDFFQKVQAYDK